MPNENPVIKEYSLMTKAQQADFRKGVRVATKDYRSSDLVLDFLLNAQSMNYVLTLLPKGCCTAAIPRKSIPTKIGRGLVRTWLFLYLSCLVVLATLREGTALLTAPGDSGTIPLPRESDGDGIGVPNRMALKEAADRWTYGFFHFLGWLAKH